MTYPYHIVLQKVYQISPVWERRIIYQLGNDSMENFSQIRKPASKTSALKSKWVIAWRSITSG